MSSIYTFTFTRLDGRPQALADWRGQVLLLVNVASRCGFTPQYAGLEMLWQRYRDAGLIVIGFPCDQFAGQEPGDEAKIAEFCTLNYGVDFPMAAKIKVNGADAHPLWQWLKHRRRGLFGMAAIKWNFTKFLIGRNGQPIARYSPIKSPEQLEVHIVRALGEEGEEYSLINESTFKYVIAGATYTC